MGKVKNLVSIQNSKRKSRASVVRRRFWYYVYKIVLLMWMVVALTLSIFLMPINNLSSRFSVSTTMFLATAAALYVTSSDLPKTSILTRLDKLVNLTLAFQLAVALEASVMFSLHKNGQVGIAQGNQIDSFFCFLFLGIFIAGNLVLFYPPLRRFAQKVEDAPDTWFPLANALRPERIFKPWPQCTFNDPWGAGFDSTILSGPLATESP
jgi:hypothetical protein